MAQSTITKTSEIIKIVAEKALEDAKASYSGPTDKMYLGAVEALTGIHELKREDLQAVVDFIVPKLREAEALCKPGACRKEVQELAHDEARFFRGFLAEVYWIKAVASAYVSIVDSKDTHVHPAAVVAAVQAIEKLDSTLTSP